VRAALSRVAAEEREDLAQAARAAGAEEERVVRAALAGHVGARPGRQRRFGLWLLAAAAVALALVLPRLFRSAPDAPEVRLSPGRIAIVVPEGGADFARLEWTDSEPDGLGYHVEVVDSDTGDTLRNVKVGAPPLLTENGVTQKWPDRIVLIVEPLDRAGNSILVGSASAELVRSR
jgi:hypothetical protein